MIDWYTKDNKVDEIGDVPIIVDDLYAVHRRPSNPLDPNEQKFSVFYSTGACTARRKRAEAGRGNRGKLTPMYASFSKPA